MTTNGTLLKLLGIAVLIVGVTFAGVTSAQQQENEDNDSLGTATAVSLGEQVSGEISTAGDIDYYAIAVERGQTVTIQATGGGNLDDDEGLWFSLPGDSNQAFISPEQESDTGSFTVDATDTAFIAVENLGDTTGAYEFNLTSPPAGGQESEPNGVTETATAVTLGEEVSGEISTTGDIDYYAIAAEQGQTITLQATGGDSLDTGDEITFDLPGEYNDATISAETESDTASFTVSDSDTYYISVESLEVSGGQYEFSLSAGEQATPEPTDTATPESTEEPADHTTAQPDAETLTPDLTRTESPTPSTAVETSETATMAQESPADGGTEPQYDTIGESGPGFGVLIAIVSLLAAMAVGLNRT